MCLCGALLGIFYEDFFSFEGFFYWRFFTGVGLLLFFLEIVLALPGVRLTGGYFDGTRRGDSPARGALRG